MALQLLVLASAAFLMVQRTTHMTNDLFLLRVILASETLEELFILRRDGG